MIPPTDEDGNNYLFMYWTTDSGVKSVYTSEDYVSSLPKAIQGGQVTFKSDDITLTAVWGEDKDGDGKADVLANQELFLTYDANGGTNAPAGGSYLSDTTAIVTSEEPTAPANSGYIFMGWVQSKTAPASVYSLANKADCEALTILHGGDSITFAAENITLYAVWGADSNNNGVADVTEASYKVTLVNGDEIATQLVLAGDSMTLPTPEKSGYTFDGWSDGTGTYTGTYTPTGDITLYAQWTKNTTPTPQPTKYDLVYSYNDGTGKTVTEKHEQGESVTLPSDLTREGYTFTGWNTAEDGTGETAESPYTMPNRNVTLYAQWKENDTEEPGEGDGNGDGGTTPYVPVAPVDPSTTGVAEILNTQEHTKYLEGIPGDLFGPELNMTRAEAAVMFYRLLLEKNVTIKSNYFTDVPDGKWYTTAVNTLAALGIVEGYGDGRYGPDDELTRAEFVTMAMRFSKLDTTGTNIFKDVSAKAWYYDYVVGSIKYGWITGSDGLFRPDDSITRAEVTTVVNRMLGRAADEEYVDSHTSELVKFGDLTDKSYWAYYQIIEATNDHSYVAEDSGTEQWESISK
jgi:uncharacterized repeat protein (TIGR02543 family)